MFIHSNVYKTVGVDMGSALPCFTSIGCYTIVYYSKKEDCYCGKCATNYDNDCDPIIHVGTYDEGPDLECTECGRVIESSYGEV